MGKNKNGKRKKIVIVIMRHQSERDEGVVFGS